MKEKIVYVIYEYYNNMTAIDRIQLTEIQMSSITNSHIQNWLMTIFEYVITLLRALPS